MKKIIFFLFLSLFILSPNIFAEEKRANRKNLSYFSEMRIGILQHDFASRVKKHESGTDINLDIFLDSPHNKLFRMMKYPRPLLGVSAHSENQTHQFYFGLTWDWEPIKVVFVNIGGGGAIHTGELQTKDPDRQRLGSRTLFRFALSLGYKISNTLNISIFYDHMSNGHTAYPNNGLEKVGLQFGYFL